MFGAALLAAAGCTGEIVSEQKASDPVPAGSEPASPAVWHPAPRNLARLTAEQYRNAVQDLFGDLPELALQPDTNPYLFTSIGATSTPFSELGIQQLEEASEAIAEAVFESPKRREKLLGCTATTPGDACVESFLERIGRRLFRRPLTTPEKERWLTIATDLAEGDPWRGAKLMVTGLLQSPNFVYRVELGAPTPSSSSRLSFNDWEMASRLSFALWNSIPDEQLLDAAAKGQLSTATGVSTEARRLVADPRAAAATQEFFSQYLDLRRLDTVKRDTTVYPEFSSSLISAMRVEVRLLVDDLVRRRNADVRGLFSTQRTFVNSELARHYGLSAPQATDLAFVPVELPANGPRAGVLTLGAFLTMNAHEVETSPTLRGKYIRERVLCESVPAPPDDASTVIEETSGQPKSLRERLEQHRKDPACKNCHEFMDPPGLLFEEFDALGRHRSADEGGLLDASGDLDGEHLDNAKQLALKLAKDERVSRCIVKQLFRHVQGRLELSSEEPALDELHRQFANQQFSFNELLVALVSHGSFRNAGLTRVRTVAEAQVGDAGAPTPGAEGGKPNGPEAPGDNP